MAELEAEGHLGHAMEVLKANALDFARRIDELRRLLIESTPKAASKLTLVIFQTVEFIDEQQRASPLKRFVHVALLRYNCALPTGIGFVLARKATPSHSKIQAFPTAAGDGVDRCRGFGSRSGLSEVADESRCRDN